MFCILDYVNDTCKFTHCASALVVNMACEMLLDLNVVDFNDYDFTIDDVRTWSVTRFNDCFEDFIYIRKDY